MSAESASRQWHAVVLAMARPGDAGPRGFGIGHKCLLPLAGEPMLARVVRTLARHRLIGRIVLVIDDAVAFTAALGSLARRVEIVRPRETTARSVAAAVEMLGEEAPVLVTTADHVLLDREMIDHFLATSEASGADATIALARAEAVLERYPESTAQVFTFADDKVIACNLYGLLTGPGREAVEAWDSIEADHRQPVKLATAFGLTALVRHLTGTLDLETAFRLASRRTGITVRPVFMPDPAAAIAIAGPRDKMLVEGILARR